MQTALGRPVAAQSASLVQLAQTAQSRWWQTSPALVWLQMQSGPRPQTPMCSSPSGAQ
jgi:hypothetical protein